MFLSIVRHVRYDEIENEIVFKEMSLKSIFSSFLKVVIKANNMSFFFYIYMQWIFDEFFFDKSKKFRGFFSRKSIKFELSTISEIFFMSWNHWPLWYNIWLLSWHIFTIWYYWGPFTMTFCTHRNNNKYILQLFIIY